MTAYDAAMRVILSTERRTAKQIRGAVLKNKQEVESLFRYKKILIFLLAICTLLAIPPAYSAIRLHTTLPDSLVLTRGQNCKIEVGSLITTQAGNADTQSASAGSAPLAQTQGSSLVLNSQSVGKYDVDLRVMGAIPVKTVAVDVVDESMVIPGGNTIGIKIHTEGVLVVGISYVEDGSSQKHTPAKDAGLHTGDIITKVDGVDVKNSDHFSQLLAAREANAVSIEYVRNQHKLQTQLTPVTVGDTCKIGAWVRDSTAGIGTVTFYRPGSGIFGALGHGIADVDTGQLLKVGNGTITGCQISSVTAGERGTPGELKGVFSDNDIGVILENSNVGLYGKALADNIPQGSPVPIATRFEINAGPAQILSSIDGETVESYEIQIEKVMTSSSDAKGMILHVTDPRLLEKTGGIVQGMSGSPIMQNGKLVGAVTHVFVNDPTRGYGIFVELMMDQTQQYR